MSWGRSWLAVGVVAAGVVAATPSMAAFSLFGFHCCYHMAARSMLPTIPLNQIFAAKAYLESAPPARGDVILFLRLKRGDQPYVKRVVGLPGDSIQMLDGALYVNGKTVKRERVGDFAVTDDAGKTVCRRWHETLPNGVSYDTIDGSDDYALGRTPVFETPPGQYFVLGDWRDNSLDSREQSDFGFVPLADILGKVTAP
jgi:signal peptidase I